MDKSVQRISVIPSAYLPSLWVFSMSVLSLLQRWKFQQSLLLAHYNCRSIDDSIYCFEAFPSNTLGIAIRKQKIGRNLIVQSDPDQRFLNQFCHLIQTNYLITEPTVIAQRLKLLNKDQCQKIFS